jgi:Ca-activated chloride channel homolog
MSLRIENPWMLLAFLPLLVLLCIQLFHWQSQRPAFAWRRFVFTLLGFTFGILGLARIQAGSYELRKSQGEGELYLAIDVSKSMLAEDILPTRLQFTATFCEKLLQLLPRARVAVFPFAADGFMLMPLSTDHLAAVDLLKGLSPSLTTDQGTDLSVAMETLFTSIMRRRQNADNAVSAEVVLLTDGESHRELDMQVFNRFRENKIPIYTVGVGTPQGATLFQTLGFGNFRQAMRDPSGKPVVTKLSKEPLEKIASTTQGLYLPSRLDQVGVLAKRIDQRSSHGGLQTSFQVQREFFPELLALAFILLTMELFLVRWEYLVRILTVALIPLASPPLYGWTEEVENKLSRAGENRGIVAYNEALGLLDAGNYSDAADLFLESAGSTNNLTLRKQALYNLGNAQLRQMDPLQAMAAYQQAIDTRATDDKIEREANTRASDNLVLAARMQQQMSQGQGDKEQESNEKKDSSDPGGPKKDFKAQEMDTKQKQKMFDLISEQEREVRSRLQKEKNQKKGISSPGKDW